MKVYGISEIARALDADPGLVGKWRERHKLPAPDAELATGPVWLAGTIEPLLAAGGPEPSIAITQEGLSDRIPSADRARM